MHNNLFKKASLLNNKEVSYIAVPKHYLSLNNITINMKIIENNNQKTAQQLYVFLTLKLQQLLHEQTQTNFTLDFMGAFDRVKVIFTDFPDFEGFTIVVNEEEAKISSPYNVEVPVSDELVKILYAAVESFLK